MPKSNPPDRPQKKQQAQALLQQNRLTEARVLYADLCQSDKSDAEAYYMLGVINGKLGKFGESADCFKQVIAIQPQAAMAHFGLGSSLKAQNKLAEAADSLRQAVRIKPDMAGAYFELGNVLYSLGNLAEAAESLRQALRLNPTADVHFSLGKIQFTQGLVIEAITSYQAALRLNPARADIYSALGFTLFSVGSLNEAEESCRQAIKLMPEFPNAHNNLGRALTMMGRIDEALASFREALRLNPDFVRAACCIVATYEMAGDFQNAVAHLAPLIEKHPDDPAVAMTFARLCKHMGRCPEAEEMIEKVLQQQNIAQLDKRELHFSLGKIYDAAGSYDAAFAHYQSANATQPLPYDPAQHSRDIEAIIETFSADAIRQLPRASHGSARPVFIIGMPRSGTSLVEQILASHPKVFGAGELKDIGSIVAKMGGFPQGINRLTEDTANRLAQEYLDRLDTLSKDAVRVTDKMPHNFRFLGLIQLLFPNAKIIHCMRSPLDTSLSIYFQYLNASHAYACNLEHIGTHYREYKKLMAHWRQVLDIPMLEVRYEDVVTNPGEVIPKLVEFCGLEWEPDCLRFYENKRIVSTVSYDQVRQPLHPKSIDRWKHYENHLEPLKSALGMS